MVGRYKDYIESISKQTGFISSTLEKVERLLEILAWINNDQKLKKQLVLKGGTAINTAIFNFPRLSVDIDLDFNQKLSKDEMLKEKENIHHLFVNYLIQNGYKINLEKSKNVYALDSIVAEYHDIKGNIDNIKIEINYMSRIHILETKELVVSTDVFEDKNLTIHCLDPIEIYAAKICALLNRTTARDLFDVYSLSKYNLFDEEEKELLRKCFMIQYIAINHYKIEDLRLAQIDKINKRDIKVKLLPTLKDRNPNKNDVEEMKRQVKNYLKEIIIIDEKIKEFYEKFQEQIFEPELLFDDEVIIKRLKEHPMIQWKLNH